MRSVNVEMPNDRLDRVLDRLCLERGDAVMLHTAYSRVSHLAGSPAELIDTIIRRLGPLGTLVMPRYAWHLFAQARPWNGYAEFLRTLPPIDLRWTPANIGTVPEFFRKLEGVHTSVSHFWPVCARGPLASSLLEGQAKIGHAYGPGSVFARLVECDVKIVGLGVTLNTTSVAPVADWHIGAEHHCNVFTDAPVPGLVIDQAGELHRPNVVTMRSEAVRDIKPSRILAERLRPAIDFPFFVEAGNMFFSYRARLYHDLALAEARIALREGRSVPWLN
jgi:aminoglycoside N3'-acetyltransferase